MWTMDYRLWTLHLGLWNLLRFRQDFAAFLAVFRVRDLAIHKLLEQRVEALTFGLRSRGEAIRHDHRVGQGGLLPNGLEAEHLVDPRFHLRDLFLLRRLLRR